MGGLLMLIRRIEGVESRTRNIASRVQNFAHSSHNDDHGREMTTAWERATVRSRTAVRPRANDRHRGIACCHAIVLRAIAIRQVAVVHPALPTRHEASVPGWTGELPRAANDTTVRIDATYGGIWYIHCLEGLTVPGNVQTDDPKRSSWATRSQYAVHNSMPRGTTS